MIEAIRLLAQWIVATDNQNMIYFFFVLIFNTDLYSKLYTTYITMFFLPSLTYKTHPVRVKCGVYPERAWWKTISVFPISLHDMHELLITLRRYKLAENNYGRAAEPNPQRAKLTVTKRRKSVGLSFNRRATSHTKFHKKGSWKLWTT